MGLLYEGQKMRLRTAIPAVFCFLITCLWKGDLEMTVTVIIPTYKPDKKFRSLIEMLTSQTRKADRVVIMNTEAVSYTHLGDGQTINS